MKRAQRWLLGGGLLLMTGGLLFGLFYGLLMEHGTLLVLKDSFAGAVSAASQRNIGQMRMGISTGQEANYRLVRAVDVHTHILKMATVLLLAGLLWPILTGMKHPAAAAGLVGGAIIFPAGVFLEIYSHSRAAQGVAALGAALAILSFAVICWKLFSPASHS